LPGCRIEPEFSTQEFNGFGRVQDVPFQTDQIARRAPHAQHRLSTEWHNFGHVPRQTARTDPVSHREFQAHACTAILREVPTVGGQG